MELKILCDMKVVQKLLDKAEKQMNLVQRALDFAYKAHKGQTRKDGVTPYIVHPIEVMRVLQQSGVVDEVTLVIALLHDVVEDTPITSKHIYDSFGKSVADGVERLTKPEGMDKSEYLETFLSYTQSQQHLVLIKAADRICNVLDFMTSGDGKYAWKYLNKADAVFEALEKIHRTSNDDGPATKLMRSYLALYGELHKLYG